MTGDRARRAVIVDDGTDSLATRVATALLASGAPARRIEARRLALSRLVVEQGEAVLDGESIRAVLFRARPDADFGEGFLSADASFASSEVSAAWLAVLALPSVGAVNRPDAEGWFTRAEWSVWRRRLARAGVPLIDLEVGDTADGDVADTADAGPMWLPWGGGVARAPGRAVRRCFASAVTTAGRFDFTPWFAGEPLAGTPSSPAVAAARLLATHGVELAGIATSEDGRVAWCTAYPELDEEVASAVAPRIAARLTDAVQWAG